MIDDVCCECKRLFTIEQSVQNCEVRNCVQDTDSVCERNLQYKNPAENMKQ